MRSMEFRGRSILVTGASRGIGRASALAVAEWGPRLFLTARSGKDLGAVAEEAEMRGAEVRWSSADLSDSEGIQNVLDWLRAGDGLGQDGLAGLVHSAGVCALSSFEETSLEALDVHWRVNVRGPFLLTARLLPELRRASGHVVFINSGAGRVAKAGWSAYAVSKHGLKAAADALREEVGPQGIRVTTVYPGRTATDMQASVRLHEGKSYDPSAFVQPEDVAAGVLTAFRTPPPAIMDELSIRPMPTRA